MRLKAKRSGANGSFSAYFSVIRVARTIAALSGSDRIWRVHVAEVTVTAAMPAKVLLSTGHISLSEAATSGIGSQLANMLHLARIRSKFYS
jgi:hypothetical protein